MDKKTPVDELKKLRNDLDLTQAEFGESLGVGQQMVDHWESGRRPVSVEKALLIQEKFGVDASTLNPKVSGLAAKFQSLAAQAA